MLLIILLISSVNHVLSLSDVTRFIVIADSGTNSVYQHMVADTINTINDVDFMIIAGDSLYPEGFEDESHADERIANMYPNQPIYITGGNHDALGGTRNIINYASTKDNVIFPDRFYYIDTHHLRIIFIDSVILTEDNSWRENDPDTWNKTSGYQFIENALQPTDRRFIIVSHYPAYDISKHGGNTQLVNDLVPLLQEKGCDIIISGHSHVLEHIHHNNIHQFLSGAASKIDFNRNYYNSVPANSIKFIKSYFGFLVVDHDERLRLSMTITFYDMHGFTLYRTQI